MLFILDSTIQISQLHSDLKSYGLNPTEWTVLKEKKHSYKIQSKEDQNFAFVGEASKKGRQMKWKKLVLVSL